MQKSGLDLAFRSAPSSTHPHPNVPSLTPSSSRMPPPPPPPSSGLQHPRLTSAVPSGYGPSSTSDLFSGPSTHHPHQSSTSFLDESSSSSNPPPVVPAPPPLHPPPPALKPGPTFLHQHHHHASSSSASLHPPPPTLRTPHSAPHQHHLHHHSQHDSYPENSSYLMASGEGGYDDLTSSGPLALTQQDPSPGGNRVHPHPHLSLPPLQQQQPPPPPPPPDLQQQQQQQPLDLYQDYFPQPSSSTSTAGRPYFDQDPSANSRLSHYLPSSSSSYLHDYHSNSGLAGRGVGANADPGQEVSDPSSYFYSSTPLPSGNQAGHYRPFLEDQQQNCGIFPPTLGHHPPQHFQPSPAVLLHVKYVMESICEWMQFTDVTLVTRTERVRAHRAILASHSTFLRQLLIDNSAADAGGECGEEPVLIVKDIPSAHLRLMMQFFYTGEVSLSTHEDVQPLRESCSVLGVSSFISRLDELSFSLQCLPHYGDEQQQATNSSDAFRYEADDSQPSCQTVPRPRDSATTVYGTYPVSPSKSLSSPIKHGEDGEQKRRRKKTLKSCAREEEEEEDVDDLDMEDEPTEAEKALETSTEDVAAQDDTAATNFDTSLLDDNDIHVTGYSDGNGNAEEKVVEAQDENTSNVKVNNSEGRVKKKAFGCSKCSSRFYSQEALTAHERVHEGKKPFVCHICDLSVSSKNTLKVHMRVHSGEKPFACQVCEKSFKDKSSLKRHQPVHGGVARKQLECGVCNREFSDRSTFLRHQRELHPPSAADEEDDADEDSNRKPPKKTQRRKDTSAALAFGCNICKKSFKRRITMATHVSRVHGIPVERPGSKKDPSDGRQPIEKFLMKKPPGATASGIVTEEKKPWSSIKCPQCDMIFCKRSAMEVHLRTHTGDKPYFCDVCGKKFARSNNLRLHTRIHTGEKPYVCTWNSNKDDGGAEGQCKRAFSDVSALKRHLRTHTGERPFRCEKCGRTFSQKSTSRAHEKNCKGPSASANGAELSDSSAIGETNLGGGSFKRGGVRNFNVGQSSTSAMVPSNSATTTMLMEADNSLSVMAGSEPPVFNTDTLDSVRASCL